MRKMQPLPPKERHTAPLSTLLTPKANAALLRAAKDSQRTKSAIVSEIVEMWLKEAGYLK